jgi:TonB family protein
MYAKIRLAVALLCALASNAGAGLPAPPPVSARPPAEGSAPPDLAALLGRLPPGSRPASEGTAQVRSGGPDGERVVERIPAPAGPGATQPDWLEVEYTVDPELEERVRDVLAQGRVPLAHVILMDPATGEVFAYVSSDPESFPATRAYPTASLMKLVTAAAVLRHAPEAAGRSCRYHGSPWELRLASLEPPAAGGHNDAFWQTLAMSNNQCFARLAIRDVGEATLLDEMRRVGLLEPPAARHPAARVLPVRGELDLAYLGSGLAGSFISPLAAARLASVLATGELVRPWWIARVRDASGRTLALPGSPLPRPVWPPEVAGELRELLVSVTERGTARSAFHGPDGQPLLGPIRVAGKTGSLSGRDPAGHYQWFIGVAPAEAPRVAVAVLVVNGAVWFTSASAVAAATLREVFCGGGPCDAGRVEALHARARARASALAEQAGADAPSPVREAGELDRPLRPVGVAGFELPASLRASRAHGEIVLLLRVSPEGEVVEVRVDSSDLPQFDAVVAQQVSEWRFTPPTWHGHPVEARARLPIPIDVR